MVVLGGEGAGGAVWESVSELVCDPTCESVCCGLGWESDCEVICVLSFALSGGVICEALSDCPEPALDADGVRL